MNKGWLREQFCSIKAGAKTWPRWLQGEVKTGHRVLVVLSSEEDSIKAKYIIERELDNVGIVPEHIGDF